MPDHATQQQRPQSDLSPDIQRSVKKEPLDRVKCVHVFGDYYRCNWWAPLLTASSGVTPQWAMGATHFVRKSAFFRATSRDGQVIVEEVVAPAPAAG